jgi:hypothetical protein
MAVGVGPSAFAQGMIHNRTPIQWMDFYSHKVMAVINGSKSVELYFSDGETFSLPLPTERNKEFLHTQVVLTEDGIDLIAKQIPKSFFVSDEKKLLSAALQFYHISYESLKNGTKEWTLRGEMDKDVPSFEIIPVNSRHFLTIFPMEGDGIIGTDSNRYDWATFGFDNKKTIKTDQGYWLDSASSGYYFDRESKQNVSKTKPLSFSLFNSIVHTKNYLTVFNLATGRMLVFSKETGKLKRRAKLIPAVPPEQDNTWVCAYPVIALQPDLDDSIIVLAHNDINILKSIDMIEKYKKLLEEGKGMEGMQLFNDFRINSNDVQWYRVNLESGTIEKRNKGGDVPDIWDDMKFPNFIPFGYDNILWGGMEKGFAELIGTVFKKPAPRPLPLPDRFAEQIGTVLKRPTKEKN